MKKVNYMYSKHKKDKLVNYTVVSYIYLLITVSSHDGICRSADEAEENSLNSVFVQIQDDLEK